MREPTRYTLQVSQLKGDRSDLLYSRPPAAKLLGCSVPLLTKTKTGASIGTETYLGKVKPITLQRNEVV